MPETSLNKFFVIIFIVFVTSICKAQNSDLKSNKNDSISIHIEKEDSIFQGIVLANILDTSIVSRLKYKIEFYAYREIRYPQKALDSGVGGNVIISFVVTATGEIANAKVIEGIGFGCDNEALRAIKSFHQKIPIVVNGKPLPVKMISVIRFSLE